jgi:hypothetical protein
MSDDFLVQPDSLRKDAAVWDGWKGELTALSDNMPTIDALAFSLLPGAQDVASAYGTVSQTLIASLADGAAQFTGFSEKLTTVAEHYDSAEQLNLDDIATTSSELDAI